MNSAKHLVKKIVNIPNLVKNGSREEWQKRKRRFYTMEGLRETENLTLNNYIFVFTSFNDYLYNSPSNNSDLRKCISLLLIIYISMVALIGSITTIIEDHQLWIVFGLPLYIMSKPRVVTFILAITFTIPLCIRFILFILERKKDWSLWPYLLHY